MKKINLEDNISILEDKIKDCENKSKLYEKLLKMNRFLYEDKHGFKMGDLIKFRGRWGYIEYGVILG